MPKGGKREGAGRKKGTRNRTSNKNIALAESMGKTPLRHMLEVLNDPSQPGERRDKMAIAAAPYVHPKLANVTHTGQVDLRSLSNGDLAGLIAAAEAARALHARGDAGGDGETEDGMDPDS